LKLSNTPLKLVRDWISRFTGKGDRLIPSPGQVVPADWDPAFAKWTPAEDRSLHGVLLAPAGAGGRVGIAVVDSGSMTMPPRTRGCPRKRTPFCSGACRTRRGGYPLLKLIKNSLF